VSAIRTQNAKMVFSSSTKQENWILIGFKISVNLYTFKFLLNTTKTYNIEIYVNCDTNMAQGL